MSVRKTPQGTLNLPYTGTPTPMQQQVPNTSQVNIAGLTPQQAPLQYMQPTQQQGPGIAELLGSLGALALNTAGAVQGRGASPGNSLLDVVQSLGAQRIASGEQQQKAQEQQRQYAGAVAALPSGLQAAQQIQDPNLREQAQQAFLRGDINAGNSLIQQSLGAQRSEAREVRGERRAVAGEERAQQDSYRAQVRFQNELAKAAQDSDFKTLDAFEKVSLQQVNPELKRRMVVSRYLLPALQPEDLTNINSFEGKVRAMAPQLEKFGIKMDTSKAGLRRFQRSLRDDFKTTGSPFDSALDQVQYNYLLYGVKGRSTESMLEVNKAQKAFDLMDQIQGAKAEAHQNESRRMRNVADGGEAVRTVGGSPMQPPRDDVLIFVNGRRMTVPRENLQEALRQPGVSLQPPKSK